MPKVQFTADQHLRDKLAQAQALMRHQIPDGDIAKLVERAFDLLIEHKRKQLFGAVREPSNAFRGRPRPTPIPGTFRTR